MATIRFFIFNLLGNVVPMLVALIAMPVVSHFAGVERLGAIALIWTLVGYFSFLDFGLSRVVTRRVAQAVEQGRKAEELNQLRSFFWWWLCPGLVIIAILFMLLRFILMPYLPNGAIGQELQRGWCWIAWSLPATLAANWLRGILEGLQRFARVSALRTVFGAWTYAAPALVAVFMPTLELMIFSIFLGRSLGLIAHIWACVHVEPGIINGPVPQRSNELMKFAREGGWMSVSNLISPLMVYFDRFVLATLVPAKAVAWYATSQEAMLGARMIPGALAGVLFPRFAAASGARSERGNAEGSQDLYQRGVRVVAALMLPLCVLISSLAYDGMMLWMGESFAANSFRIVEILAIGLFANSIAQLPFAYLQGHGKPKLTAQIHLVELPVYVVALYFSVVQWGVIGAAWVWTLRVLLDCLVLLKAATPNSAKSMSIALSGSLLIMALGLLTGPDWSLGWRIFVCILAVGASLGYAWLGLLNRDDRSDVLRLRYAY